MCLARKRYGQLGVVFAAFGKKVDGGPIEGVEVPCEGLEHGRVGEAACIAYGGEHTVEHQERQRRDEDEAEEHSSWMSRGECDVSESQENGQPGKGRAAEENSRDTDQQSHASGGQLFSSGADEAT